MCKKQIKVDQENQVKVLKEHFDKLLKKISKQKDEVETCINESARKIDSSLSMIEKFKDIRDKSTAWVIDMLDAVNSVETQVRNTSSELRLWKYYQYTSSRVYATKLKKLCGDLSLKDLDSDVELSDDSTVELSDDTSVELSDDTSVEEESGSESPSPATKKRCLDPTVTAISASDFRCSGYFKILASYNSLIQII